MPLKAQGCSLWHKGSGLPCLASVSAWSGATRQGCTTAVGASEVYWPPNWKKKKFKKWKKWGDFNSLPAEAAGRGAGLGSQSLPVPGDRTDPAHGAAVGGGGGVGVARRKGARGGAGWGRRGAGTSGASASPSPRHTHRGGEAAAASRSMDPPPAAGRAAAPRWGERRALGPGAAEGWDGTGWDGGAALPALFCSAGPAATAPPALASAATRPSLAGRFLGQRRPRALRDRHEGLPGAPGCRLGRFGRGCGGAFPLPPSAQVVGSGQQTKGDLVTNNGGHVERNFCS